MTKIAGANALIFGGANGIGRCIALELGRRGARVAVADIDEVNARQTARDIEDAGGKAVGLAANVLVEESVAAAAGGAEAVLGAIDILMNNVGVSLNGYPEDIPSQEWMRIMDLNYYAAVRAIKHFLPKFLARGAGHIVNTASFAGLYPYAASRVPYAASKAAVIALSENLAIHLEPKGIRVSCLIPGPVMTNISDSMINWSPDCVMVGPGSETTLLLPERVAEILADGMEGGRIMIPSDDVAFDIIRRWAESPDAFIRERIDAAARGERGMPMVPESLRR